MKRISAATPTIFEGTIGDADKQEYISSPKKRRSPKADESVYGPVLSSTLTEDLGFKEERIEFPVMQSSASITVGQERFLVQSAVLRSHSPLSGENTLPEFPNSPSIFTNEYESQTFVLETANGRPLPNSIYAWISVQDAYGRSVKKGVQHQKIPYDSVPMDFVDGKLTKKVGLYATSCGHYDIKLSNINMDHCGFLFFRITVFVQGDDAPVATFVQPPMWVLSKAPASRFCQKSAFAQIIRKTGVWVRNWNTFSTKAYRGREVNGRHQKRVSIRSYGDVVRVSWESFQAHVRPLQVANYQKSRGIKQFCTSSIPPSMHILTNGPLPDSGLNYDVTQITSSPESPPQSVMGSNIDENHAAGSTSRSGARFASATSTPLDADQPFTSMFYQYEVTDIPPQQVMADTNSIDDHLIANHPQQDFSNMPIIVYDPRNHHGTSDSSPNLSEQQSVFAQDTPSYFQSFSSLTDSKQVVSTPFVDTDSVFESPLLVQGPQYIVPQRANVVLTPLVADPAGYILTSEPLQYYFITMDHDSGNPNLFTASVSNSFSEELVAYNLPLFESLASEFPRQ